MNKKLVLENRFTNHQKVHILLTIGGIPLITILYVILKTHNYLVLLIAVIIYIILISVLLTKKGLLKKDNNLYKILIFKEKVLLKEKVNLEEISKITTLKFNKSQKMAWFSNAKPDLSQNFTSFDITLLNNKHTSKTHLTSTRNELNAKKAIEFLASEFDLKEEIYSPDFS